MKTKHKVIYILSFLLVIFTYLIPIPFLFIYYPILIYVVIKSVKQIKREIRFDKLKEKCMFIGVNGNCYYKNEKGFNKCSINICIVDLKDIDYLL